jgi:hypothetical protein
VRVPDEAGLGVAKVTFSYDAWKDYQVKTSTIELPVKKPEPAESKPETKK